MRGALLARRWVFSNTLCKSGATRMNPRTVLVSIAAVLLCGALPSCAGVDAAHGPKSSDGEGLDPAAVNVMVRPIRPSNGDERLVFPPPPPARHARGALPAKYAPARKTKLSVLYPRLGDDPLRVYDKSFYLTFNQPVKGAAAGVSASANVLIAPAVQGSAVWIDARTLQFNAKDFLDPAVSFQLKLRQLTGLKGQALDQSWSARLKSMTGAMVANKTLGYVPASGDHRVVAVLPEGGAIGTRARLAVLYDQAIGLALARSLVKLVDAADKPVDVVLAHPHINRFDGLKIDRRKVVLVRPRRALKHGESLVLRAADAKKGPERQGKSASVEVAEPLVHTDVLCSWYSRSQEICALRDGVLKTTQNEVHLRFNNMLRRKNLSAHVQLRPRVRNLMVSAEGWDDGRLVLRGAFQPSTRYRLLVAGVRDVHGNRLRKPLSLAIRTMPLGASVAMPEGLLWLDEANTKRFVITSRNVAAAELQLWRVDDGDVAAFRKALRQGEERKVDEQEPTTRLTIAIKAKQDKLVDTKVDLRPQLKSGGSYLAKLVSKKKAFGAEQLPFKRGSAAARSPIALLRAGNKNSLAVHAHSAPSATLVYVARLGSGEPVAGASLSLAKKAASTTPVTVTTDASGVAVLAGDHRNKDAEGLLQVVKGSEQVLLPLSLLRTRAKELFPDLSGRIRQRWDRRAFVMSDRGIYRPGATVGIKAHVYRAAGGAKNTSGLAPLKASSVRLRVLDPAGRAVCSDDGRTNDLGGLASRCQIPADAKLGLYRIKLEDPAQVDPPLAAATVRVAAFQPPRFLVDVDTQLDGSGAGARLKASIHGRYSFGAHMDGAPVRWSLRRTQASLPASAMVDAGLSFHDEADSFMDEVTRQRWSRTGDGVLDKLGQLVLDQALPLSGVRGPQRFVLEAEVSDSSYRHLAGRSSIVAHPAKHYVGLRAPRGWVETGSNIDVRLGVIDHEGRAVAALQVGAKLELVRWRRQLQRGPGGALRSEWRRTRTVVGRCVAKSKLQPVSCKLRVPRGGSYVVTSTMGSHSGGATTFYAWRDGDSSSSEVPSKGNVLELIADKARYKHGDSAKLLVRNPFAAATAILTVEAGALRSHQVKRIKGAAAVFDMPIDSSFAPQVHASITLLPIGAKGEARAAHRIAALTLPVETQAARLTVSASSNKPIYAPGAPAVLTMKVSENGKPKPGAEVAVAVVDEGVLRLTGHRAVDPVAALYPALPLSFSLRDTRGGLAELFERSHVSGDGGGEAIGSAPRTRSNFVKTALFEPSLRTNSKGEATVNFKLPDNLTTFRIMAVAVDGKGRGGAHEASFRVSKPLLLQPIMPRFAKVGDRFEAGVMIHNNQAKPFEGVVRLAGTDHPVKVAAQGRARVTTTMKPQRAGLSSFIMEVSDRTAQVLDRVEAPLRIELAGIAVKPKLAGAFEGSKQVALRIPADTVAGADAHLLVKVGEHLWPELGARLEYLLDYPHGCVEQTTSSTLPLIAARTILPRIGIERYSEAFFHARILAGLKRLASMRTSSGGLAYWPGGSKPNVYGTAYAIRAVIAAKEAGVEEVPGLLEGMSSYLASRVLDAAVPTTARLAIAQSLAELGKLPPSAADALFDLRKGASAFARASLALALSRLDGQADRVSSLLAELQDAVDDKGGLREKLEDSAWRSFASDTRSRAQLAIALGHLRPASKKLPLLVSRLVNEVGSYTTQGTAYSLLATAQHVARLPDKGAAIQVSLDDTLLTASTRKGAGATFRVPLGKLVGNKATLRMSGPQGVSVGFMVSAAYKQPTPAAANAAAASSSATQPAASLLAATSSDGGPDVHRIFSDAQGKVIDLTRVKAGQTVRVALLVRMSSVSYSKRRYLALTDHLPAGFEPIQPDLATVATVSDIQSSHPLSSLLRWGSSRASHVELHDDRVQIYFDRAASRELVATYLVRATTPGSFALPPATAELMYQPDSLSYSDAARVTIQ